MSGGAGKTPRRGFRARVNALLHSRLMPFWLVLVSVLENTILFVPMEPLLIAVLAARRRQAFLLAGLMTLGCTLGAALTYIVAAALFEPVVEPLMQMANVHDNYQAVRGRVVDNGFWAMFLIGVTPVPFQLGTVAAGVVRMPFAEFLAAVVLSRGLRYTAMAALVYAIGAKAETLIGKYEVEIAVVFTALFVVLVLGGWLAARL